MPRLVVRVERRPHAPARVTIDGASLVPELCANLVALVQNLGDEPYAVEAISKVLALLVPRAVPLMPAAACAFVLGDGAGAGATTFAAMVSWLGETAAKHHDELSEIARTHPVVSLEPAQALDRLLWFDSEGYRHFPALAPS